MATLVATGLQILLARRREQGRGSSFWERVWDGVVWGRPVALLVSALTVVAARVPPLPVYWSVTIAICGVVERRLRAGLWLATGIGCLALSTMQALGRGVGEATGLGVEMALCEVGIVFLVLAWRASGHRPVFD